MTDDSNIDVIEDDVATDTVTRPKAKRIGVMWDTESLGLHHGTIVREVAFAAFDLDDPETILMEADEHLPLLPQELLGRPISLETVIWLLDAPDKVKEAIRVNANGDVDELLALLRSLIRKFERVVEGVQYETWFARPQHDVPMLQSLFAVANLSLPWTYDTVNDLRTLMNEAGMSPRSPDVKTLGEGLTLHTAQGDCLYQIRCYQEAVRRLRGRG